MARKSAIPVTRSTNAEEIARVVYVKSVAIYEETWKLWNKLGDRLDAREEAGKPRKESLWAEFYAVKKKIDRQQRDMFRAFDQWNYFMKHTISVDEAEIRQVILDALDANQEAMPQNILDLPPLDRHRAFKQLASDIVEELKSAKTHVFEEGTSAPLCEECAT